MSVPATPLGRLYARTHAEHADRAAVRDDRRELTFGELGTRSRRLAQAFRRAGAGPGERIALLSPNCCEWVEVEHAAALGGLLRVGLLPRLHTAELAHITADSEPAVVVVDGEWLAVHGRGWIPDSVAQVVVLGPTDVPAGCVPFEEFVAAGTDDELPLPEADADAWLLYTSGSTGHPKGVRTTHASIGALIRNALDALPPIGPGDTALHTAPVSHFSGGIAAVLTAAGGLNVLHRAFEPARVADLAEQGEITVLPLVPTMITMLLEELDRRGTPSGRVGDVRLLPYAGSAIRPDRAERARAWFGEAMQQVYGASEAMLPITTLRPGDHVPTVNERGLPRLASAGRVTRHVELEIVDEQRHPLPPGSDGEIRTRGEHVGPGYWRQPEATAETFSDGWAHTGDVGYLDENGYLFILDRRKDMIITGGFNVYPSEIENVVSSIPGVHEVAVVGAPSDRWGEEVTAFVVLADGTGSDVERIIRHCREHLGGYKVPKSVVVVDELPKTGTGKIQKQVLRADLWRGRDRRV
ncbi:AMP-binding protein [Pseudonocardia sp. C8]|uniref:class I adenylate-forming enzyme family protein n=1 Tax=Pseudonocardia sp. C8 TaxID=2762759 RepID=UPI00164340A8|nr:AMP-binding protein [Pseudonocardia sp. C8]MBC3191721.1 AMP-binding protein [Pseudonocardia sp. C8]